jgi:hypothetical protein
MSNKVSNIEGGERPLFQNLQLDTLQGAKKLYAEVVEAYAHNIISEANMRALVYALSNYLPYLKFEADLEIEERLNNLEELLKERGYEISKRAG